jgi:hypothetical protein
MHLRVVTGAPSGTEGARDQQQSRAVEAPANHKTARHEVETRDAHLLKSPSPQAVLQTRATSVHVASSETVWVHPQMRDAALPVRLASSCDGG